MTDDEAGGSESREEKVRHFTGFFVEALVNPAQAIARRGERGKLSLPLLALLSLSLFVCYLLVETFPTPALAEDEGNVLGFLRTVNYATLPVVAGFLVVLLACALHGICSIVGIRTGALQDTANAALVVAAVLLPIYTVLVLVVVRMEPDRSVGILGILAGVLGTLYAVRCIAVPVPEAPSAK